MEPSTFYDERLATYTPPEEIAPGSTQRMDPLPEPEPNPEDNPKRPFPVKAAIVAAVVVVLCACIAAALVIGLPQAQEPNAEPERPEATEPAPEPEPLEVAEADAKALQDLIGKDDAAALIERATTSEDANWIVSHQDSYALEGPEVQQKILRLAAVEPAAEGYVRLFPQKYPQDNADAKANPVVDEATFKGTKFKTAVPHLFQWDPRWAYTEYSSTTFGLTGCGPTSMAMIYQGITGKTDLSPYDMSLRAQEAGFMSEYNGTGTDFFYYEASQDGFGCYGVDISADGIVETLKSGDLMIANLGPGYFTVGGHFFVLAGLASDGSVIVNDPYSLERSSKTWDADFIASESIALFGFSKDATAGGYTYDYDYGYDYDADYDSDYDYDVDADYGYDDVGDPGADDAGTYEE